MRRTLFVLLSLVILAVPAAAKRPDIGPTPPLKFTPPKPEKIVLPNGGSVYLMEDHRLPVISLSIMMRSTPVFEPADKVGLFGLFSEVWRAGGTKNLTPDELNDQLEYMASSVDTSTDEEMARVSMWSLSKNFDATYTLFLDVLKAPRFDAEQLSLAKAKAMEAQRRKNDDPGSIARRAFRDVSYGPTHVYARNPTNASIDKINRSDFEKLYASIYAPNDAIVVLTGDFNKNEMLGRLNTLFGAWPNRAQSLPAYDYEVVAPLQGNIFLVEKDITQSRVSMGRRGVARHNPDHFALNIADYILGGGGTSRLFAQIRSRLGLAYSVGSFVTEPKGTGLLGVGGQTKATTTGAMIKAFYNELDRFSSAAPSDHELGLAKDATKNSFVFKFNSPAQIANEKASLDFYGFPADYLDKFLERIAAVGKNDVLNVARKYYVKDAMKVMVVGNRALFDEEFKTLGEPVLIPIEKID
jgi:zinc protease